MGNSQYCVTVREREGAPHTSQGDEMVGLRDLRPGDLMFTTISGLQGKLISLAEKVNDPIVTWDEAKKVQHVGIVTAAAGGDLLWPLKARLVQAMPGGAEEIELTGDYWTSAFIYVRPNYRDLSGGQMPTTQGRAAATAARHYIGVPYSFLDYAAIAAHHLHMPSAALRRYVSSTKHMICSQLADQAMSDAGFHVFDDGRIPQDVTPAALYHELMRRPETMWTLGGTDLPWLECKGGN